jgi:aminoglycoside phosphotransferase (APT) family kinase protein
VEKGNMDENQIRILTECYITSDQNIQNLSISDSEEITDGWETKLYKYTINYISNTRPFNEQHVIRLFSDKASSTSEKEYRIMIRLQDQGYPVPTVFQYNNGDKLGNPFILMEYLSGNTLDHRFRNVSDSEREVLFKQMIELFVDLHRVNVSSIFPENKLTDTEDYISFLLNMIENRIKYRKLDWVKPVVDWLAENRDVVDNRELSVLHGDFHGRNIVYREDGSPAVIDWSGAHVGDNRFDLAWTIILFSTFGGSFFRELLMNMYSAVAEEEIKDIEYFEVLGSTVRLVNVFPSFLTKNDVTGVVSKSGALTPDISDHFHKVYDMVVSRTGIKLPEFERLFIY